MSSPRVNLWIVRLLVVAIAASLAACGAASAPTLAPTAALPTIAPTSEPSATMVQTEEADESTPEVTAEATGESVAMGDGVFADAVRGDSLFHYGSNGAPPCSSCHVTDQSAPGRFALGPNLGGMSERASTRIEGFSAEDYIHQSIVEPTSFLAPGFRNSMFPRYGELYSAQDIADLIAYLLTL
ncbi:MAG: c-type cytochrome [Burkholderiales bacterium]|nr:c-type cytochrome [Anaerolineae bacterium]